MSSIAALQDVMFKCGKLEGEQDRLSGFMCLARATGSLRHNDSMLGVLFPLTPCLRVWHNQVQFRHVQMDVSSSLS